MKKIYNEDIIVVTIVGTISIVFLYFSTICINSATDTTLRSALLVMIGAVLLAFSTILFAIAIINAITIIKDTLCNKPSGDIE
jgi:hypothetical protein